MPKIVDHDARRAELARRAIPVFQVYGYHGIGMRKIAEALEVPKSSLYHYFPTKHDLFLACTEALEIEPAELDPDPVAALVQLITQLEHRFSGELRLMVDYLGPRPRHEIQNDPALQLYRARLDTAITRAVGAQHLPLARTLVYGLLLDRWLAGQTGADEDVHTLLDEALAPTSRNG